MKYKFSILHYWSFFNLIILILPVISTLIFKGEVNLISKNSSYFIVFISILIILRQRKSIINRINYFLTISQKHKTIIAFSILVFLLKFVVLVYPITSFTVPMLHDPYAHSMWAKEIFTNDEIAFFYSPLLHSFSATMSFGNVGNIPKLIFLITQLSVILIPLNFSILYYHYTKKVQHSFYVFLLLSIFIFPADLYFVGGKNSLILGLALVPAFTISLTQTGEKPSILNSVLLFINSTLLFFAHYPLFGIVYLLSAPYLIQILIKNISVKNYQSVVYLLFPIVISILLSSLWFINLFSQVKDLNEQSVRTYSEITMNIKGILEVLRKSIVYNSQTLYNPTILIPFFVMLFQKSKRFFIYFLWGVACINLLNVIIKIHYFKDLTIVYQTLHIVFPLLLTITTIYSLVYILKFVKISEKSLRLLSVFIFLLAVTSNVLLGQYTWKVHNAFTSVDEHDLSAYEFINSNLPLEAKFINSGREDSLRKGIIYATDGALWLPFFTNRVISIDFLQFSSVETNENYILLKEIIENDSNDSLTVNKLKDKGYTYAYLDQGIYGESLKIENFDEIVYEIIFESGPVKIVKFY